MLWALVIAGIAWYENVAVDPWRFVGENRGPIFFSWSTQLVFGHSSFGDLGLVLRAKLFWAVLLAPTIGLLILSLVVARLMRRDHNRADDTRNAATDPPLPG
jgi:hypothetical protein